MRTNPRTGYLVVALLLALAIPANAGPYEDGLAAYQQGDYATALKFWRPLAEQGDAEAQYSIGLIYANGQGVKPDYGEAVKWYRVAAEQGLALAQNNLGFMYANGRGVPKDFAAAYMWLTLAAAQGESDAHKTRDQVVKLMTHGQIEEAHLMIREWKAEHRQ